MHDQQLAEDYGRFRSILKAHVENIRERQPEVAKGDGLFDCYDSIAVFHATYPNPQKRREMLDRLAETAEDIDQAVKWASEQTRDLGKKVEEDIRRRNRRNRIDNGEGEREL